MLLNKEQVMDFLPHREPFLFIDSLESLELPANYPENPRTKDLVGAIITAKYSTTEDHPIFAGHFPGHPILPGVVQIEMIAQGASFVVTKFMANPSEGKLDVALLSVSAAKFRKPIYPGMDLTIINKCEKIRGLFMTFSGAVYHNGELMSEATVLASVKF